MAVSRHGDTPDKIDNFCQAGQSRLNHKLSCGAASAAPAAARPAEDEGHTVVLEWCHGAETCWMYREPHFSLRYGPAAWLQHMHWSYWGPKSADGSGWFWEGDAVAWRVGHVNVRLYRPEWRGGWHYFTRMYMPAVGVGKNHQPAEIWRYEGNGLWGGYRA